MTEAQEVRIVKGTAQAVTELIEFAMMIGMTYYIIHPEQRDKHLAILRTKRNAVIRWLDVQDTLASIRGLPEQRNKNTSQM